jgi:valyl-tRNA synthetase
MTEAVILEKGYDPKRVEDKWYKFWIERKFSHGDENSSKESYSIVIPPPNVTGSLHIGHALNVTMQDILARWKRMEGYNTSWIPGTDHAGIATQNVVEKQLAEKGQTRQEFGREAFIKRVWEWKEESGGTILQQLKRLGASCDWERERFTMDEGLSRAVREVFVSLYEEGLIYKDYYITNWCPRCHTALSDLEVEYQESEGKLYHIKYPLEDGSGSLIVATTRPETMLGDTALAVNPEDERYTDYLNKKAVLPIVERVLPIIPDKHVDTEFGTGVLKVTPAHDPHDFEIGKRHNLHQVKVIGKTGLMNKEAGIYEGLDVLECRKRLVSDLKEKGFLIKIEDYHHSVGHCYRCKVVIEPLPSKQWFVRMKPLAEPAIKAVKNGKIRIIPKGWENTYFEWMNNIRDWCISRQIWWGHRIPAWYCKECNAITVSREDPDKCNKCGSSNIEQETDVLDTWFSSALWPFSTMGWPEKTKELTAYYPTSVLVTSFDILFFWVARMIMMGLKFMKDIPFRDVYIHALIRDAHGEKMSKTRGNVINPLVMVDKYGTDAFRFTLAALSSQGRDISLSEDTIEGYRHFANKIWNSARFTLMNLKDDSEGSADNGEMKYELADIWILSRLHSVTGNVKKALGEYKFNEAASLLYQFVWHEFCDWYIELIKPRLNSTGQDKKTVQSVLVTALDTILRLLHPFMPFITEEIWQNLPRDCESIMITDYPRVNETMIDNDAEKKMKLLIDVITAIRNIRGEMGIAPGKKINVTLNFEKENNLSLFQEKSEYILSLAKVSDLTITTGSNKTKGTASAIVGGIEIFIPLEGVADIKEESKRLEKKLEKVKQELAFYEKKFSNKGYMKKAPKEVIEKDKSQHASLKEQQVKLEKHLQKILEIEG